MLDPGTSLAITSLAIETAKSLLAYYELWSHADRDIKDIQKSIIWLANLFTQLEITLQRENLQEEVALLIRLTVKGCEGNISKLQTILGKIRNDGSPKELHANFKNTKLKVLYMFQSKAIKKLMEVLHDLKDDLKLAINLLDLNTSAESLDELQSLQIKLSALKLTIDESNNRNKSMLQERRLKERHLEILDWLAPCNITIAHHSAFEKREAGTGDWLLLGHHFDSWCSTDGPFLWLHGDVGCGKTVLCASIIEDLVKRSNVKIKPDNVVYFYFAFDNTQCQNLWGFLKSALAQLCPKDSTLPQLADLFRSCIPDLPSLKELQIAFLAVLHELCEVIPIGKRDLGADDPDGGTQKLNHTFIIIDGLDEIPYGSQRQVVLEFLRYLSGLPLPRLHILATSRLERDIEGALKGCFRWQVLGICRQDVQADIDIYITSQIAETPKLQSQPESIKAAIKDKLVIGADGMFRWSALQMEVLKSKKLLRGRDILKILSTLPLDLDATYERILTNIDDSLIYEAVTALKWLSCASRPIFIEELVEACIIRPDESDPVEDDQRISPLDILEILPGLVRIEPTPEKSETLLPRSYTITLSHFSVKEYLFSDRIQEGPAQKFSINLGVTQYHITRSCLAYVAYCEPLNLSYQDMFQPLYLYAHSRWPLHAALVPDSLIEEVSLRAIELFQSPKLCLRWIGSTGITRRSFAEKNKPPWLELPLHACASPYWPLHYILCHSVTTGNKTLIQILLESGLQVHSFDVVGQPLKLAAGNGDTSIVHLLLQAGANRAGALMATLRSGHEDIARILLKAGVKTDGPELVVSAKRSSSSLFKSLVAASSTLRMIDVLKALDAAIGNQKYELANTLLEALVQRKLQVRQKRNGSCCRVDERNNDDKLFFNLIIHNAIRLDSSRTLLFVLRYMSKAVLNTLDTETLFLTSVVQGHRTATHVLSNYLWFPISTGSRNLATHWKGLIIDSHASTAVVALHRWYIANGLRMPENGIAADVSLNWESLRTLQPGVVAHYSQSWSTHKALAFSERYAVVTDCGVLQQNSNRFQRPQSSYYRLEAYMVLSGPYSSFLKDIYAAQSLRQIVLQSPQRVALRSALPHEAHSPHSDHHSFLNMLPWLKFLDPFSTGDGTHLVEGVRQLPPSSISAEGFSFELCDIHVATASERSPWWSEFMDSYSHEIFHAQQLWYLTANDSLVQDSETSDGRVQRPGLMTTIERFAMHIKVRPSKERRGEHDEWLQRNFPYHAVIHGICDTMRSWDPKPITLPCNTIYEEIMSIDILSDRPEDLVQWWMLADLLLIADGFISIFPQRRHYFPSLSQDNKATKYSPRKVLCLPIRGDLSSARQLDDIDKLNAMTACFRFLKAILKTRENGWTLRWSKVGREPGQLTPMESCIKPNQAVLDTNQICEALMEFGSVDDAKPDVFTLDKKLSGTASLSKVYRFSLNIQAPPQPPEQYSQPSLI